MHEIVKTVKSFDRVGRELCQDSDYVVWVGEVCKNTTFGSDLTVFQFHD